MGNSESQYTFQGARSHSSVLPGAKPKHCSLKIRSIHAKDNKSLQGWGQGGSLGAPGYKSRSLARSCFSHFKTNQPYAAASRQPGSACKPPKDSLCCKLKPGVLSEGGGDFPENGFHYLGHEPSEPPTALRDCNGHLHPCLGDEDPESPRVRIKTLGKLDGHLRVEFHSGSGPGADGHSSVSPGDSGGPVQLLRYSPTSGDDAPPSPRLSAGDSHPRSSKGSSLSSESSWYDSPWGPVGELGEHEGSLPAPTLHPSLHPSFPPRDPPKPFKQSSSLCSLRELGPRTGLSPHVSFASDLDLDSAASRGGQGDLGPYTSFTLPCRKSGALSENAPRKDSLKARMCRISDWTGSLSRKKRRLQEPRSKEGSDFFDSRQDGLNLDLQGPSLGVASSLWSGGYTQLLPQRSESAQALGGAPLRQMVYENFMRELALSRAHTEPGETSSETAETSSESLSSLEQLDLLFEKEQGVVRKAGWLFFKPLVTLQKERKLELVARRKWKHYWVTLKGCTLLFYETYGKNSTDQSSAPCCALFAEDSIVQSVPEHPKKENVFCLSNSFGDVYLFQANSQTDLENWVTAIHSACASLFAKKRGKEDTVRLLRSQTRHLAQKIDMDSKMRKMAELQLSVVSDPKNRKAIENQIQQWGQNLEKFHIDLFRTRCYLASLQGGELPNPKSLLAVASRHSKLALGRLGVLSVSSFHALVCSREDSALRRRTLSLTRQGRSKRSIFSSLKALDTLARRGKEKRPSITQVDELLQVFGSTVDGVPRDSPGETQTYVHFADNQGLSLVIKPEHKVEDVLALACKLRQLEPSLHGLQLRRLVGDAVECCVPAPDASMQDQVYDEIEVFPLRVYDVQLTKTGDMADFGFAVMALMDQRQHLYRIFVSDVLPDGSAFGEGLRKGNEIMTLNGEAVSSLDLKQMEALFSEKSVCLTLLARPPDTKGTLCSSWSDSSLFSSGQRNLLPPPNQSQLLEEFLDNLKKNSTNDFSNVPDITTGLKRRQTDGTVDQASHLEKTEQVFRSEEQIATLCRNLGDPQHSSMEGLRDSQDPPSRPLARHLSDADRLRKVIQELVDTEKSYVKDLSCLFELYLEPLQNETFLTQDEMESLFGSLPEMLEFQKVFLETLEDGIAASSDFNILETPSQFRKLLFSLGGSFLYYADHFKLYSGFCANHIKVQKVLERARTDRAFKAFLDARNPTKQHSSTLESFLIKPVQRVLKYPLLLKELVSLTDHDSEEHYHLTEALKAMEKVASHINEMQKIYEDYGTVFDQLVAEQSGTEKEVTELSMGELLTHSTVSWLNPLLSLGKTRKDLELTVFVFKRAVILVYKENCKLKKKSSSNSRPAHGSADLDPFKFRWLIPISALQVRLGNAAGTENSSIWELIHTKSEVEGRPETIFQLCCSDCESKTSIVKVIRSILRENFRRHIKCEQPLEKACKDRLVPLKNRVPVSAKLASSRSLKVLRNSSSGEWPGEQGKGSSLDSDEGSLSSGTPSSCQDPPRHLPPGTADFPDGLVKESDILSDEDEDGPRSLGKQASPTRDIEIQFQRLSISEEPDAQPSEGQPKLVRAHFCPIKRKANSTRRDRGTLLRAQIRHQSLDSQPESAGLDLSSVLQREFSVQSLASVVNEECFYETESHAKS
ncbi:rho guanine nucleotide exchange factor TIAM2 isoform X2 [Erinaceus europaeus]|uniref:Rho guanine nucleotide exchange factor TIAM2 isoform X2 n=1 Tax=Erinaceus europaeus TaxID=9365 RepID=A0ABM3YJN7_ERIEU|nr:rho guanine nucleotide exchange factor TIAM2 isoform X2 [Erinaceus europaeus]